MKSIAEGNAKCRDCAKKAAFLNSLGAVHNPFSVHRKDCLGQEHPAYADDPKEDKRIETLCFTKAEGLARLLAEHGERGFDCFPKPTLSRRPGNDNIVEEAIDRLALLLRNQEEYYHAAKCAGHLTVSDNEDNEDDYKIYAKALKMLLQEVPKEARRATSEWTANLNIVSWAKDREKAWCYKAALASAWVAYAHSANISNSWTTLKAGRWREGDLPTWRSKAS